MSVVHIENLQRGTSCWFFISKIFGNLYLMLIFKQLQTLDIYLFNTLQEDFWNIILKKYIASFLFFFLVALAADLSMLLHMTRKAHTKHVMLLKAVS